MRRGNAKWQRHRAGDGSTDRLTACDHGVLPRERAAFLWLPSKATIRRAAGQSTALDASAPARNGKADRTCAMNAKATDGKSNKLVKGATGNWEVVIGLEVHAQVT